MDPIASAAFAFAAGLTLAGMVATIAEIVTRAPVRLAEPPLDRSKIVRSLALTAFAGPFMLGNEALAAFADGAIGRVRLCTFAMVAGTWALSLGVLTLWVAAEAAFLLV